MSTLFMSVFGRLFTHTAGAVFFFFSTSEKRLDDLLFLRRLRPFHRAPLIRSEVSVKTDPRAEHIGVRIKVPGGIG